MAATLDMMIYPRQKRDKQIGSAANGVERIDSQSQCLVTGGYPGLIEWANLYKRGENAIRIAVGSQATSQARAR